MFKLLIVTPRTMVQMSYFHHLNYFSQNTNIEMFLFCENVDRTLLDKRISVIEVPRSGNRLLYAVKLYRKAAKLIIEKKIDWVISSYGHFNFLLVIFLLKARLTKRWVGVLFYDLRSASVSSVLDTVQNILFSIESCFYDHKMAVSKQAAEKVFGTKRAEQCFISGVGSFSRTQFEGQKGLQDNINHIKKTFQIEKDTLVILYIGTFINRDLDKFIEEFEFDNQDYCFFIIGDGDKNSETRIKDIIRKKSCPGIHLLGRLPYTKLPAYLLVADIGIAYTSKHDSLSSQPYTKILEYAEFEVLVLASDDLSNNHFIDMAEVVFLSRYKSVNKLRLYLQSNKKILYKNKKKGVYWTELSQRLLTYLKQNSVE